MEDEEVVTPETLEGETVVEEVVVPDENEELTKAQELAKNQKIRAEKAERELKELKSKPIESKGVETDGLSNKDILFLAKVDVHEDDLDQVLDWAKFKKVTVAEAYKQMKGVLDVRAEERKMADASNVSNVRRGSTKVSDEVLIANASKGKLPESDEEIDRLIAAKLKRK